MTIPHEHPYDSDHDPDVDLPVEDEDFAELLDNAVAGGPDMEPPPPPGRR